ncbi:hypothetical protein [[Actinomadura] parvosata]|uniref:hypothetical protein n=1 Tax=[Actinomadura] parvosata TaxID=1955412 RepID=UPI0016451836
MTMTDIAPPATRSPHRPPYQPPYQRRVAGTSTAVQGPDACWDGRLDTLPMLRAADIRSMERLRTIIACARQGIADLDLAIAALEASQQSAQGAATKEAVRR